MLTSFNLALALAAVPAAFSRAGGRRSVFGLGLVVFAGASLACALAPSFDVLVGARAVQGVAGAAVVCAALDLLSEATGGDARGRPRLGARRDRSAPRSGRPPAAS